MSDIDEDLKDWRRGVRFGVFVTLLAQVAILLMLLIILWVKR